MPLNSFLPQIEKNVKAKVSLMLWSPKLDLLAVSCATGELILLRLGSREKIWSLAAPESGCAILSLCWRPDGKVIAVGYSSAKYGVRFVYMEKAEILWKFSSGNESLQQPACVLRWFVVEDAESRGKDESEKRLTSDDYLPKPPSLVSESGEQCHAYQDDAGHLGFHVLLLCDVQCCVTILANGIFPIVKIHCNTGVPRPDVKTKIIDVRTTSWLKNLYVVLGHHEDNTTGLLVEAYKLDTLKSNMGLYYVIAQKLFKILSLKTYLSQVFDNMTEACDAVMQEMDTHLTNFLVKTNSAGTIGDDLMQLLLWGKPTESLKHMLTQNLTKKGIKKLGQLVEMAYAEIQKLLSMNFQMALDSLYYNLTEIKGLLAYHKDILPLLECENESLIATCGSLFLKLTELLQVIDTSLKNFKAFFRWLYVSMLKMQNEPVDKLGQMSENEIAFVADYIYEHFNARRQDIGMKKAKSFQLEKVYQYLKDEPLSSLLKTTANDWYSFVNGSSLLNHSGHLIHHRSEASFRQIFNELSFQLRKVTTAPEEYLTETCKITRKVTVFISPGEFAPKCHLWVKPPSEDDDGMHVDGTSKNDERVYLLTSAQNSPTSEAILLCLSSSSGEGAGDILATNLTFCQLGDGTQADGSTVLKIVDLDLYDATTATLLLSNDARAGKKRTYLVQAPLVPAMEHLDRAGVTPNEVLARNSYSFCQKKLATFSVPDLNEAREVETGLNPAKVVTSGPRNVSCVLSADLHRIVPYLMDHSEDDEDLDETNG